MSLILHGPVTPKRWCWERLQINDLCAPVTSPSLPIPTKKKKLPDYKKYEARPCCPVKDDSHCIPNSTPCPTRTSSTYFDSVHPTEPNNIAIATRSYKALLPTDVYPYDIHQLTQVKL
ncbi:putative triacylglycerol lipase [Helianthus anomalus]